MSDGSAKPANDPAMGNHNLRGGKGGQQGPGTMATDTGAASANFSSLYEQKRPQDPEAAARRQSINEQKEASSGMLGKIFKSVVKGE